MKKYLIILLFFNFLFSNEGEKYMDTYYKYNDNGRIIIPDKKELDKLPKDGGEKWNRLVFEYSPYLLQHAANPVDWYPWGDEAFEKAIKEDKPIFLSIGYTTCHWCHVMEHESFEDNEVAELMNNTFINVKLDREERPDIDNVYMEVTQKITGRGGWPMTVIMTPDKKPFFAGTYFPKKSRSNYKRIGMLDLVPSINDLWINKKDSLINSAEEIVNELVKRNINRSNRSNIALNNTLVLENGFKYFNNKFDKLYGGFSGSRNKFPKPHDYSFLARYYYRSNDDGALEIINKSLYSMKQGGIYDQIGFGFHRYSTDQKWLVPHFEKMLYDQAMLIHAYLDAYQLTKDDFYASTVHEICEYVLRDMVNVNGGFYSAEDADSEGEEGVFYIWNANELKKILNQDEYSFISDVLNIQDSGNSRVEGHKTNIPHFNSNWGIIEKKYNKSKKEIRSYYHNIRNKIFIHRNTRVHPQKDDKILTDWNGLMISALARSSVLLDNDDYLKAAKKAADFIINNLIDSDGGLLKRFRNGNAAIPAMIEDYAFFIWGLIELYQSDFDLKYINKAVELSDYQINHFWDTKDKGFFFTSNIAENLIVRSKEIYDGAIPSGNSVSAYNYIRIARILSRPDYEEIAYDLINSFAHQLNRYSHGSTMLLHAVDFITGPSYEVIITGSKTKSLEIISSIQKHIQPNKVIIFKNEEEVEGKSKNFKELNELFSFLNKYPSGKNGEPLVYVCKNYSCNLPTSDIGIIHNQLSR